MKVVFGPQPASHAVLNTPPLTHCARSPFALPALLLAAPAIFYGVLAACGWTLEDSRAAGWVSTPQPGDGAGRFWRAWGLYGVKDFPPSNILWAAMPGQVRGGGAWGWWAIACGLFPCWFIVLGLFPHHTTNPLPTNPPLSAAGQAAHALLHRGVWKLHGHCGHTGARAGVGLCSMLVWFGWHHASWQQARGRLCESTARLWPNPSAHPCPPMPCRRTPPVTSTTTRSWSQWVSAGQVSPNLPLGSLFCATAFS